MPSYAFDAPSYRCNRHGGIPEPGCLSCELNETRRDTDRARGEYSLGILEAAILGRDNLARDLYHMREEHTANYLLGMSQSEIDRRFGSGRETSSRSQELQDREDNLDYRSRMGNEYSSRDREYGSGRDREYLPSMNHEYGSTRDRDSSTSRGRESGSARGQEYYTSFYSSQDPYSNSSNRTYSSIYSNRDRDRARRGSFEEPSDFALDEGGYSSSNRDRGSPRRNGDCDRYGSPRGVSDRYDRY